jgi:hypothetical protein
MNVGIVGGGVTAAAACGDSSCTGFLVCQNFEGAGYDNSETWTEGGAPNEDSTSPILRGAQSLLCDAAEAGKGPAFAQTEFYGHVLFQFGVDPPGGTRRLIYFVDSGEVIKGSILLLSTKYLRGEHGTGAANSSTTVLSVNTTYHIWWYWKSETEESAADGKLTIWVAPLTTRDKASATQQIAITNGTSVETIDKVYLYGIAAETYSYDQVLIKTTDFTTVCE